MIGKRRLLLIEDNPGDARLIQEMLSEASDISFDLECAGRLSTGLAHLAEGDIDVVLLDLGLPDSQGLDTFTRVYAQAPEVPIVVLTGLDDVMLASRAVREGAQDYLVKNELYDNLLIRATHYAIERKQAEKRIRHLNSVLKAIRTINQLVVVEKDRGILLQKACDTLIETRGYDAAWLGFLKDGENFATVVGSGLGEDVPRFCEHVMSGDPPPCIRNALTQKDCVVIVDKSSVCGDCFFKSAGAGKRVVSIRVEHTGRLFGLLTILLAADVAVDDEERDLLREVAGDIAFALHSMEMEEARKRAEEALKEHSERLEEMVEQRTQALRDAQEELVRKEKLAILGQLAGGMGHELRNPLGAIKNAAYFLNMVLEEPDPEVKETLKILEKEVMVSERIISSLLDYARVQAPARRKVDVNDIVREALSRVPVPDDIEVVSQLDEGLPIILADPDQLGQVFGNIILNGIQAMTSPTSIETPKGGRLVVKTAEVSDKPPKTSAAPDSGEISRVVDLSGWVAISFADTGVGIPEENLEKIFEPLFTTKAKGIGLGLAITKMAVEGHGGSMDVESEVGKGSIFTVRLPLTGPGARGRKQGAERA